MSVGLSPGDLVGLWLRLNGLSDWLFGALKVTSLDLKDVKML